MDAKRIKYVKEAILISTNHTRTGFNNEEITQSINQKVLILSSSNTNNSSNNVKVQNLNGEVFWVSYKDLQENMIGLDCTYQELRKKIFKSIQNNDQNIGTDILINKIITEIGTSKLGNKNDFIPNLISTRKYNISLELLLEIYFLYNFEK